MTILGFLFQNPLYTTTNAILLHLFYHHLNIENFQFLFQDEEEDTVYRIS